MDLANLERLCTENPTSPLFARLAEAYLAEGRKEEARHILEVGLESYPTYVTGSLVYAKYLLAEKQYIEAQNFLLHVAAFSADYPGLRALLERCQAGLHPPVEEVPEAVAGSGGEASYELTGTDVSSAEPASHEQPEHTGFSELHPSEIFAHHEEPAQPVPEVLAPAPESMSLKDSFEEAVPEGVPDMIAVAAPEPIEEIVWPPPPPVDHFENASGTTFMERAEPSEPEVSQQNSIEPETQSHVVDASTASSDEWPPAPLQNTVESGVDIQSQVVDASTASSEEWPPARARDLVETVDVPAPPEPEQVFASPAEVYPEPEQVFNTPEPEIVPVEAAVEGFGEDAFGASQPEEQIAEPAQSSGEGVVISSEVTTEDWPPAPPAMADESETTDSASSIPDDFGVPEQPIVAESPAEPASQLTPDDVFGTGVSTANDFGSVDAPTPPITPAFTPEPMQVQGGRIVSKTLAEIYTAQGVYEEAVLTYKLLKQQRPEENAVWDARIAELEKKIKERGPQ